MDLFDRRIAKISVTLELLNLEKFREELGTLMAKKLLAIVGVDWDIFDTGRITYTLHSSLFPKLSEGMVPQSISYEELVRYFENYRYD